MATRLAARYISRRLSSGGKVLGEEEKAAENVYIKRMEREKLEKAARKGLQAEEAAAAATGTGVPVSEAAASGSSSSASNVSTDKNRNYAVVAGTITMLAAVGWYFKGSKKKPEEVQD